MIVYYSDHNNRIILYLHVSVVCEAVICVSYQYPMHILLFFTLNNSRRCHLWAISHKRSIFLFPLVFFLQLNNTLGDRVVVPQLLIETKLVTKANHFLHKVKIGFWIMDAPLLNCWSIELDRLNEQNLFYMLRFKLAFIHISAVTVAVWPLTT